jgi:hypothetical protein
VKNNDRKLEKKIKKDQTKKRKRKTIELYSWGRTWTNTASAQEPAILTASKRLMGQAHIVISLAKLRLCSARAKPGVSYLTPVVSATGLTRIPVMLRSKLGGPSWFLFSPVSEFFFDFSVICFLFRFFQVCLVWVFFQILYFILVFKFEHFQIGTILILNIFKLEQILNFRIFKLEQFQIQTFSNWNNFKFEHFYI